MVVSAEIHSGLVGCQRGKMMFLAGSVAFVAEKIWKMARTACHNGQTDKCTHFQTFGLSNFQLSTFQLSISDFLGLFYFRNWIPPERLNSHILLEMIIIMICETALPTPFSLLISNVTVAFFSTTSISRSYNQIQIFSVYTYPVIFFLYAPMPLLLAYSNHNLLAIIA